MDRAIRVAVAIVTAAVVFLGMWTVLEPVGSLDRGTAQAVGLLAAVLTLGPMVWWALQTSTAAPPQVEQPARVAVPVGGRPRTRSAELPTGGDTTGHVTAPPRRATVPDRPGRPSHRSTPTGPDVAKPAAPAAIPNRAPSPAARRPTRPR